MDRNVRDRRIGGPQVSIAETRAAVRNEYGEVTPYNIADVLAGTVAIWTKWADALDRSHKASRARQIRGFAEHITAIGDEYTAWIGREDEREAEADRQAEAAAAASLADDEPGYCDCPAPRRTESHGDRRQCLDCGGEVADGDE